MRTMAILILAALTGCVAVDEPDVPDIRPGTYTDTLVDYDDGGTIRCYDADIVEATYEHMLCVWKCGWYDDGSGEEKWGEWTLRWDLYDTGVGVLDFAAMTPAEDC